MTDNSSTPDTDNSALTAEVTATGTASRDDSYAITPELRPHANAILAMDPVRDVPPPYEIPEGYRLPALRLTALADPQQRREVQEKLDALPADTSADVRQAKEAEFTAALVRSKTIATRIQTGVGKDATPFHREMVGIAREVEDLNNEFARLQSELDRVLRYDTSVDPATGEAVAVPVPAVTGRRAQAYAEQQADILRRIRLLVTDTGYGIEGRSRMDSALHESAVALQQRAQQIEEAAEAKQLAAQINRDRRIKVQAERLASLQRNDS